MAQKLAQFEYQCYDGLHIDCQKEDIKLTDDEGFDFDEVAAEIKKIHYTSAHGEENIEIRNTFTKTADTYTEDEATLGFSNQSKTNLSFQSTKKSMSSQSHEIKRKVRKLCKQDQSIDSPPDTFQRNKNNGNVCLPTEIVANKENISSRSEKSTQKTKASNDTNGKNITKIFDDQINQNDISTCANCSISKKVTDVKSLQKGQHISMPGSYYQNSIFSYEHHAIVTAIKTCKHPHIHMEIIHFTKKDKILTLYKETKPFNVEKDNLSIVTYSKQHTPEDIIKRAENTYRLKDRFLEYNLITQNCEHFATWCVVGESQSFQVQSLRNKTAELVSLLFGNSSKIAKCIKRWFSFSDPKISLTFSKAAPAYSLCGQTVVYLTYSIIMTVIDIKHYNDKTLCRACLKGKLLDIWLTFGAIEATALTPFIVDYVFPLLASKGELPKTILEVLLSASFQITVPRLRKALSSPFSVDCKKVKDLTEIDEGDIISIRYYGIHFKGIITKCQLAEGHNNCSITIVYYGVQSVYRTIVEKLFEVDNKSIIYLFDCKPFDTYSAEEVVKRAKSRIGETKWNMFSNRTIHFLFWAKRRNVIHETGTPIGQAPSYIEQREIHSCTDLSTGDVVQCNAMGYVSDTGIISSMRETPPMSGRKFVIDVYKLSFLGKIILRGYTIDLNKDTVYVKIYSRCQNKENRAEKAKDENNNGSSWLTTHRFIEYCINEKSTTDQQTELK